MSFNLIGKKLTKNLFVFCKKKYDINNIKKPKIDHDIIIKSRELTYLNKLI